MKTQIYLAVLVICLLLNGCSVFGGKDLKKKEHYHLDIVVVDNPDVLMSDLDNIYEPVEDKENVKIVHIALSDTKDAYPSNIIRIDIQNTPKVNIFFDAGAVGNFMNGLSPESTLNDLNFDIKESLKKLDLTSLNSDESVDDSIKIDKIKGYIADKKKTYSDIYIYSQNQSQNEFDKYVVYHNVDSVRLLISSKINQNKSSRILLIYNPPVILKEFNTPDSANIIPSLKSIKTTLSVGKSYSLSEFQTDKKIVWTNSNPNVAEVKDGTVIALSKGTATITGTDGGNIVYKITVTITTPTPTPSPSPSPHYGTKYYSFGKYVGSLKNGIPEGNGTMYYTKRVQIAKHDTKTHFTESGYVFVGLWGNGDIVNGKLKDADNNLVETILAGQRPNSYDISND